MGRARKQIDPDPAAASDVPDDKIRARLEGRDYVPSPTMKRFHTSTAFVRGIRGPVGSGKSTGCSAEIMARARGQQENADGIRRTRFVVVRNTYGELKDTTIKTWLEWFPEDWFGKFNRAQGEMRHHIRLDGIDCEVLFRALDTPEDVRKVLSLELTGAWLNEAREMPKQIVDAITDRVGRFPPMRDGGATWSGVLMDTNSPDEDHWWHKLAEEEHPSGWKFFAQPGGLKLVDGKWQANPKAENLANLPPNYYVTRAAGKREDYIRVYYGNEYGFVQEGKAVFDEYSDPVHGAKEAPARVPGAPVYIGIGLTPSLAAVFAQRKTNGQWLFLDELALEHGGAVAFAERLAAKMAADFPSGTPFRIFTRKTKIGTPEAETVQILRGRGILAMPCRESDATLQREAVAGALSRLVQGDPALKLSPDCKLTRKAFSGGYCYARIQASGEERYHSDPMQNRYAPVAEAAQVMMVGGGEASYVFRQAKPKKLVYPEIGVV